MKKITVKEALELHGLEADLTQLMFDSIVPACCEEGCEVEPDGTCEHGNPSVLIELGIM